TASELARCRLASPRAKVVEIRSVNSHISIHQSRGTRGLIVVIPRRSDYGIETNIFHTLAFKGEVWCLLQASLRPQGFGQMEGEITVVLSKARMKLRWARSLLAAVVGGSVKTVNELVAEHRFAATDRHINLTVGRVLTLLDIAPTPLWEVKAFEDSRVANPLVMSLGRRVREQLGVPVRRPTHGSLLLLSRKSPADRMLVDLSTGSHAKLLESLSQALSPKFVPFERLSFETATPFREQVAALARAAVVVSAIGSQLTNLAWMRPGVVVEVTLRWGWCNAPYRFPVRAPCVPYYKADYANQARAFGHRYMYYDPAAVSLRSNGSNPISAARVFVDPNDLARVLCTAF
ncbi:MAG: hypothetical protein SGPRY_012961, partial [Prymnesium sp.]